MPTLDFEADQKLQLLTDALRAGPGSPEWRTALADLGSAGAGGGEGEYQLLLRARERLASGRAYREVRAGPGFTRKVMEGIDRDEQSLLRFLPSANWIAGIAAAAVLGVLAVVATLVVPKTEGTSGPPLDQLYFVNTVETGVFEAGVDEKWHEFGSLSVEGMHGLRPVIKNAGPTFRGGGVVWERQIPADQPLAVEAVVSLPAPNYDAAVQIFVTDEPVFEGKSANSPHELVCLVKDGQVKVVLPGGRVEGQNVMLKNFPAPVELRVRMNRANAIVECNGEAIFGGPHELSGTKPRSIGVRFVARAGNAADRPAVQSLRVMKP
jgi:hypothetical protein